MIETSENHSELIFSFHWMAYNFPDFNNKYLWGMSRLNKNGKPYSIIVDSIWTEHLMHLRIFTATTFEEWSVEEKNSFLGMKLSMYSSFDLPTADNDPSLLPVGTRQDIFTLTGRGLGPEIRHHFPNYALIFNKGFDPIPEKGRQYLIHERHKPPILDLGYQPLTIDDIDIESSRRKMAFLIGNRGTLEQLNSKKISSVGRIVGKLTDAKKLLEPFLHS